MRKYSRSAVTLTSVVALVLAGCGGGGESEPADATQDGSEPGSSSADGGDEQEEITLTYASITSPTAPQEALMQWWGDELEERTGGKVKMEYFFQASLLAGNDALEGLKTGRADVALIAPTYFPTEMPFANAPQLPFVTKNPEAATRAFQELNASNDAIRNEFLDHNIIPVVFQPATASVAAFTEPLESVEELRGRTLRAAGYIGDALDAGGANIVQQVAAEVYENTERGLLDGYSAVGFDYVTSLSLHEVAPYHVDLGIGHFATTPIAFNLDVWESLTEETQQIIYDLGDEYLDQIMIDMAAVEEPTCDAILESGGSVIDISEDPETLAWREQSWEMIRERWLESAGDQRAEAEEMLDEYLALVEKHEAESDYVSGFTACADRMAE